MPKAVITAAVDIAVASQIASEARSKGRSVSKIVNLALMRYLERKSKGHSGRVVTVRAQGQLEDAD